MKLSANGLVKLVHGEAVFEAVKGFLEVPEHLVELAIAHGAALIKEAEAGIRIVERVVEKPVVVERVVEKPVVVERVVEKQVEKIVEVEKPDETDPSKDGADSIDTMKRGELCASLKALSVPYKLPIGNDDLRKLLRDKIATLHAPTLAAPIPATAPAAPAQSDPTGATTAAAEPPKA